MTRRAVVGAVILWAGCLVAAVLMSIPRTEELMMHEEGAAEQVLFQSAGSTAGREAGLRMGLLDDAADPVWPEPENTDSTVGCGSGLCGRICGGHEDPAEPALIEAALIEQGYYRDDVPLSYELQEALHTACEDNGVPYPVGLGLIEVESGFRTDAVSPAGCYGLCQLNPAYFQNDLSDAENIKAGMEYLGDLVKCYGALDKALVAYNRGSYNGTVTSYAVRVLDAAEKWGWAADGKGGMLNDLSGSVKRHAAE